MRILFISNFFPPHVIGGYEMLCADVRERLRQRGHHVDVLTSRHGQDGRGSSADGVRRVLHLEVDKRPWRGTLGFFHGRQRRAADNERALREAVAATRPDVILAWGMWNLPRAMLGMAQSWERPALAYYVADYWAALPDAYTQHWDAPALRWWTRAPKAAVAALANRLAPPPPQPVLRFPHAACVSQAVRTQLIAAGVPFQRACVIHLGVDPQRFPFRPSPTAGGTGRLAVGYAGRLDPDKGVVVLLEAFALCLQRGESAHLTLAGHATEARSEVAIAHHIDRLGLRDHVTLRGWVASEQMPALLAEWDVLVAPSQWPEPLAQVILEGMATGAVVVATPVGGTPEIVADGVNGLLCPAGDAPALAECLVRLRRDPALRAALVLAGRQTVEERFDLTTTVEAIEQFLQDAIASGG